MLTCVKCGSNKDETCFYERKSQKGYDLRCKDCLRERLAAYNINYTGNARKPAYRIKNIKAKLKYRLYFLLKFYDLDMDAALGCTISELEYYLESKFTEGMCWENYGMKGWSIDHILPLSKMNVHDKEDVLKHLHYTNLQPMWLIQNIRKSNSLEWSLN